MNKKGAFGKVDVLKRVARAQNERIRNCVMENWCSYDTDYSKRVEEVLAKLQQHHAKCVWESGYKPKKTSYIKETQNYGATESIGLSSECERSDTFNQKIYPVIEELDYVLRELKDIKSKWWYKFFKFWEK